MPQPTLKEVADWWKTHASAPTGNQQPPQEDLSFTPTPAQSQMDYLREEMLKQGQMDPEAMQRFQKIHDAIMAGQTPYQDSSGK